ncbi:MAG: ATP-binding cassette domain-containing protein, partial [Hyphomicrobiales bacterium]|nr:ATP-binding cassette domain-containing protein [Hyphomicrobiales bacterium]
MHPLRDVHRGLPDRGAVVQDQGAWRSAVIRIDAVTKIFRRTPVLDALSLEIGTGDRVALIGSNGAGKTTLIRCLLG